MVADWVSDAWKALASDDIIERGFRENGIEWNRMEWRSCTTSLKAPHEIESRNVPAEVLEEVDRLITEMRNAENEIVHDADDAASDKEVEVLGVEIVDFLLGSI